jgi:hypothetical protein
MAWVEISNIEYLDALFDGGLFVGETFSNPDWSRLGEPHMLVTWDGPDGQPLLRHQCWPLGHTAGLAKPCLFERWEA